MLARRSSSDPSGWPPSLLYPGELELALYRPAQPDEPGELWDLTGSPHLFGLPEREGHTLFFTLWREDWEALRGTPGLLPGY